MLDELTTLSRHFLRQGLQPWHRQPVRNLPAKNRLTLLLGQRGTGKTTALLQWLADGRQDWVSASDILYLQADHVCMRDQSLYKITETFQQLGGKRLAIDEIHQIPEWAVELKSIYDTFPGMELLVSGSSALELHRGSRDLSRRALVVRLPVMSFREFLELRLGLELPVRTLEEIQELHEKQIPDVLAAVEAKGTKILAQFQDYNRFGCYPFFRDQPDTMQFLHLLEQSMHTAIEGDLLAIHPSLTGASAAKLKKLLAIMARSVPFCPDLRGLKQLLDIGDERTLKLYLIYLEQAGLLRQLSGSSRGLRALEKPEKIYLDNPNQMHALHPAGPVDVGTRRETFAAMMLAYGHRLVVPDTGDFLVDDTVTIEVGGRNKNTSQLRGRRNAWLAVDEIETGVSRRIPLWYLGFLY